MRIISWQNSHALSLSVIYWVFLPIMDLNFCCNCAQQHKNNLANVSHASCFRMKTKQIKCVCFRFCKHGWIILILGMQVRTGRGIAGDENTVNGTSKPAAILHKLMNTFLVFYMFQDLQNKQKTIVAVFIGVLQYTKNVQYFSYAGCFNTKM